MNALDRGLCLLLCFPWTTLLACSDNSASSEDAGSSPIPVEYPSAPSPADVQRMPTEQTDTVAEEPIPSEDTTLLSDTQTSPEDASEQSDTRVFPDLDSTLDPEDAGEDADTTEKEEDAQLASDVSDSATGVDAEPDTTEIDGMETASTIAETCFPWVLDPEAVGPIYDNSGAIIGSHCLGTNHQQIEEVELVVFLGDSVTVGTPNFEYLLPTDNDHYWRNKLAEDTAELFGLDKGENFSWGLWKSYDPFEQKGALNESGDFRNCAHWGARTKDFMQGDKQLEMCFPDGGSDKRTLVMFTIGGNDFKEIVEKGSESSEEDALAGYPSVWEEAESIISHLEDTLGWLTDPVRFPNGVSIIFANPYEYTDGTGVTSSCASAEVLSGVEAWQDTEALQSVSTWLADQFMQIAVSSQTDMVFMLERFCGHGYVMTGPNPDPSLGSPCDAGPDAEVWFDETCVHPNAAGHKAIYEMFKAVLLE